MNKNLAFLGQTFLLVDFREFFLNLGLGGQTFQSFFFLIFRAFFLSPEQTENLVNQQCIKSIIIS